MAAAKRAAQEGVAVPLVAASLVGEGAAAGLAAQLEREGARPVGREAGTATAETRAESACSVALAAAGASGDCSTRSWVARSATWQQREFSSASHNCLLGCCKTDEQLPRQGV